MTLQALQKGQLLLRFHTLCNHRQAQAASHGDDRPHDLRVVGVQRSIADEGLVDLEGVHRQALEVGQRRIARAKIVHGETDPLRPQCQHLFDGVFEVADDDALGDLQLQEMTR